MCGHRDEKPCWWPSWRRKALCTELVSRGAGAYTHACLIPSPHLYFTDHIADFSAGNEITQWSKTLSVLTWNFQEADPEAPLEYQWLIWVQALIDKWRSKTRWELLNEQMTLWQPELSLARDFWEVTWRSPEGLGSWYIHPPISYSPA